MIGFGITSQARAKEHNTKVGARATVNSAGRKKKRPLVFGQSEALQPWPVLFLRLCAISKWVVGFTGSF